MLAPVLGAIGKFLISQGFQVWPEEVPRYDTAGNPINPEAGSVSPQIWPAIELVLNGKSVRENTFEDSYSEEPPVLLRVWGTTREEVEGTMSSVEALLAQAANWFEFQSPIGQAFAQMGFPQFWLYNLEIGQWSSEQRQLERLADDRLCWMAEMDLKVGLHGAVETY